MGKINVLDKNVSELIAAGEVVERPLSVVKELLENAIDADATAITVEIKRGGIDFIRITDNGTGIEATDVPVAFLRHATSKLKNQSDLESISTLGFRGEALASIASVSRLEMITKTKNDEFGTRIEFEGGTQKDLSKAGCPNGTTIIVRNLFYNVPARLKFLKKDSTESGAVQNIVEKLALSHPEISFRFIKDNKSVIHTAGDGKLLSAIYAVMGKDFAKNLIEVGYSYNGVEVSGYISKPEAAQNNRKMQNFFVNNRYVRSGTCIAALEEGYKNSIMVSKFPACVLKLNMAFNTVDVNVHPAKTEVRFVNEKSVYECVYFAVKTALTKEDILISQNNDKNTSNPNLLSSFRETPATQTKIQNGGNVIRINADSLSNKGSMVFRAPQVKLKDETEKNTGESSVKNNSFTHNLTDYSEPKSEAEQKEKSNLDEFSFINAKAFEKKRSDEINTEPPTITIEVDDDNTETIDIKMIGEVFKTYILFEANDTFVMIDKHAAHERILFEELKKNTDLKQSQVLLVPLTLNITAVEYDTLKNNSEIFTQFGFRFEFTADDKALLLEAPLILHSYDLGEIVQNIIKNISENKMDLTPDVFENLLHSMACRSAIKAGADNTLEELETLVRQVYLDKKIRHCPHGRPVGIVMSKYEIDKKFGRIV